MTDDIPRRYDRVEVITGVQRRRRWTPEEKIRIVEETYLPGMSVSLVARKHGVAGNQLFTWRRLMNQGALTAATAIAASTRCFAARRKKPDARRPIRNASTAS